LLQRLFRRGDHANQRIQEKHTQHAGGKTEERSSNIMGHSGLVPHSFSLPENAIVKYLKTHLLSKQAKPHPGYVVLWSAPTSVCGLLPHRIALFPDPQWMPGRYHGKLEVI
jgi:hypothetical protein